MAEGLLHIVECFVTLFCQNLAKESMLSYVDFV